MPYKDLKKILEYQKRYYEEHHGKAVEDRRKWRREHPEEMRLYRKRWIEGNREYHRQWASENRKKIKFEVLLHYTQVFDPTATEPHCRDIFHLHLLNDSFMTDIRVLTIDHINDDGAKHRKEMKEDNIYAWLKRKHFPSGFQVLCWNCNEAKRFNKGAYIHQAAKQNGLQ